MKNITMITLLIITPFYMYGQTFNFNIDGETENWVSFGSSTKVVAAGILTYTPVTPTADANIQYKQGIDASINKHVHIVLNTHSAVTETLTLEFRNLGAVLTSVVVDPSPSVGFVTYDFDLSGEAFWTGTVSDIRIRMRSTTNTGSADYYEFDEIIFDNNTTLPSSNVPNQTVSELVDFGEGSSSKGSPSFAYYGNYVYVLYTSSSNFMGKMCRYDLVNETAVWSGDLFPTIGEHDSSHNDAAIAVDGDGYIHCWIGLHNSNMSYYRSISPGSYNNFSADLGSTMPSNTNAYTYPSACTSSNGDVFVILRHDGVGTESDETQWLYHWNNTSNIWSVSKVKATADRNAYWSVLHADKNNNVHVVTAWSRRHFGANTFQKGTYLRYDVGRDKYFKANGAEVGIPVSIESSNADKFYPGEIPWNDDVIEIQTPKVTVNNQGHPVVSYAHNTDANYSRSAPIYKMNIATWTGTEWLRVDDILSDVVPDFSRPPITNTGNRINVIGKGITKGSTLVSSVDNGVSFKVSNSLISNGADESLNYNITTDLFIDFRKLYKIVYNDNSLNIEDFQEFNFKYSPNPTSDYLKLSSIKPIETIKLFNLLGQQVLTKTFNNQKEVDLNITSFKADVYLMKVRIEGRVETFKILKK